MKVFISVWLTIILLLIPTMVLGATTQQTIRIYLDNHKIDQISTYTLGDVLYAEAKPLLLADGFQLMWNANHKTLRADRAGISVVLTVNSNKAVSNNKNTTLTSNVTLKSGSVYVSVDDLATVLDKQLNKSLSSTNFYYKSSLKDIIYKTLNHTKSTYKYEGKLHQGKRTGLGKLYKDGELLYEGDFSENVMSGYGKLYVNGTLAVEGGFSNNEPHGHATYKKLNGEVYEGEFLNGKMTGRGSLYKGNTLLYTGEWLDDQMSGTGYVYGADGNLLYSGRISNNVPEGYGIKYTKDGIKQYQGDWRDGKQHGEGMLFNDKGELEFMGSFVGNRKEGLGSAVQIGMVAWVTEGPDHVVVKTDKETATIVEGHYNSGKLIQAVARIKYTGQFDENKIPNGVGVLFTSEGLTTSRLGILNDSVMVYEGSVKDGMRDGQGRAYEAGQLIYEGMFAKDIRRGKGKEYAEGQLVYDGNWVNDRRSGAGKIYEYNGNISKYTGTGTVIIKDVEYLFGQLRSTSQVRKYAGAVVNGAMTGNGSLYVLNSSSTISYKSQTGVHMFNGKFVDGAREGLGIEYHSYPLKKYEGNYVNDERSGLGKEYLNGTLVYDGLYLNNKKDGLGKLYANNSLVYEGSFKEDKKHGYGKVIKNGVVTFEGQFINDIQQ